MVYPHPSSLSSVSLSNLMADKKKERKKFKWHAPPAVPANLMFMGFENAKGYIQDMYLFLLAIA